MEKCNYFFFLIMVQLNIIKYGHDIDRDISTYQIHDTIRHIFLYKNNIFISFDENFKN